MALLDRYSRWLSARIARAGLQQSVPLHAATFDLPMMACERLTGRWPGLALRPQLGLFEGDDVLGWRLRRNADSLHAGFDVCARYTTDEEGRRRDPATSAGPALYLLGCSVTFGQYVNDGDCFASQLGRTFAVENHAVPGYGTAHHYLLMTQTGLLDRAAAAGATLVYAWFPMHRLRVWRRRSWLSGMERSFAAGAYRGNPLFEIHRQGLQYRGLIRVSGSVPDEHRLLDLMEWRITNDLLKAMSAASRRAGVRFAVALLPHLDGSAKRALPEISRMLGMLEKLGIEALPLARSDGREPVLRFPFSRYPTPEGHRLVAERLARALGGHPPDAPTVGASTARAAARPKERPAQELDASQRN